MQRAKGKEVENGLSAPSGKRQTQTRGLLLIARAKSASTTQRKFRLVAGTAVRLLLAKNVKSIGYVSRVILMPKPAPRCVEGAILALFFIWISIELSTRK